MLNYGFPFCYGDQIPDPTWNPSLSCDGLIPAAASLIPHGAAVGMRFYTGKKFPGAYRKSIFIAQHGSWDSTVPHGYQVLAVNSETLEQKPFLTGFVTNYTATDSIGVSPYAWGRPADVLVLSDGSLLVSDDLSGNVFQIKYKKERTILGLSLLWAWILLAVVVIGAVLLLIAAVGLVYAYFAHGRSTGDYEPVK